MIKLRSILFAYRKQQNLISKLEKELEENRLKDIRNMSMTEKAHHYFEEECLKFAIKRISEEL